MKEKEVGGGYLGSNEEFQVLDLDSWESLEGLVDKWFAESTNSNKYIVSRFNLHLSGSSLCF